MELLARDLKPINVESCKHDEHCRCDVKTNTCKRRKVVAEKTQSAFACAKLTIETLEQGVKFIQS